MGTEFDPETQVILKSIEELDSRHAEEKKHYENIFQKRIAEAVNKKRIKKEEEKERKNRIKAAIDEENEKFLRGELTPQAIEKERLNNLLKQNGLKRKSVPSDGDCMFSSLAHQLKPQRPRISVEELREIAADHLLKNRDQFAAFLESDIELYYQKLVNEPIWGGQIELTALAAALETR